MAERELSKIDRKRDRQPISVPFIWEERPGTPKKDWKPTPPPIKPVPTPVKLVVSVPFGWEEKPGTPLPYLAQFPTETSQEAHSITCSSPPIYSDHEDGGWSAGGDGIDDQDGLSDSELDTCSNGTDDSFSSAPCLLANGLISTATLSGAIPVPETSLALSETNCGQLQSPGSPASETDSIASSYATGNTSLAGASFLEWLFPLLVPNSRCIENDPSPTADDNGTEFLHGSNGIQVKRPLLTLGELIVMSRRRSCQRKINEMHKQPSMDFLQRNSFGCWMYGSGGINAFHKKWKRQLQLKLI